MRPLLKSKKIGVFIPVRLGSKRLEKKHLIKINRKTLIEQLISRLINSKFINSENIILCTTLNKEDDILKELANKNKVEIYRGDESDIIKRYYDAAIKYKIDLIVSVNGDNPLTSIEHMDKSIKKALDSKQKSYIVTQKDLPLGCSSYVFNIHTLKRIYQKYITKENDTGFIFYFTKTGLCQVIYTNKDKKIREHDKDIRLTVDYPDDIKLIKFIFMYFKESEYFSIYEVLKFLNSNLNILQINKHLEKDYWKRTKIKAKLQYYNSDKIIDIKIN